MRSAPPSLPLDGRPWPATPPARRLGDQEIAEFIRELAQKAPPALGLFTEPGDSQGPIKIWLAHSGPDKARHIDCLCPSQWDQLTPMVAYLAQAKAPYVVMAHGQATLHDLAQCALVPQRLGCLQSAHTLLARATGQAPSAHLRDWVQHAFARHLSCAPEQSVDCLLPLMRHQTKALRALGLTPSFDLECRLLPAVVAMERAGMPVDAAAYERVTQGWAKERSQCQDPARQKRLDKLLSTYRFWARDYLDSDAKIRCQLDPLATESGRFSCANPNLQQVPNAHTAPGLRQCFRPEPGYVFVIADYAQIELRVAAHIANCKALRELFIQDQDPHRNTAATLRGCKPQEVAPGDRKLAKAINFGFLFGMGAGRFASYAEQSYGLSVSDAQAKAAKSAFLSAYPGIAAWQRHTAGLGRNQSQAVTVKTAMGRIKHFPANAFRFNAALNIPVQGTAAEGFKKAMLRLHRELPPHGGAGVLCIHDEYIAQVPTQRAAELKELVVTIMEQEMQSVVPSVPIRANASIQEAWT